MNLQTLRQPAFLSGYLPAYPHLLHTYPGAIGDGEYARRKRRSRRCRSFPVLHWHSLHRSRSALGSPVLWTVVVVAVMVGGDGAVYCCWGIHLCCSGCSASWASEAAEAREVLCH